MKLTYLSRKSPIYIGKKYELDTSRKFKNETPKWVVRLLREMHIPAKLMEIVDVSPFFNGLLSRRLVAQEETSNRHSASPTDKRMKKHAQNPILVFPSHQLTAEKGVKPVLPAVDQLSFKKVEHALLSASLTLHQTKRHTTKRRNTLISKVAQNV